MKKLGIIGLGTMGYPISKHLIDNGFSLYTYVRSERSRDRAQALGIQVVETPGELARYTDTVILLVADYNQCQHCLCDPDGIFATMGQGTVIISSTVDPRQIQELGAISPPDINILDAPVSGGAMGAEQASLVTMVAGDQAHFLKCGDIFSSYARKAVYVGPKLGQAQALKAVNQMLVGIHMVATAESMALATGLGINPVAMLETISECAGNSNIFRNRMPKLIAQDFAVRASLETLEKDTKICMDLAESVGVPCYLTEICHKLFQQTPRSRETAEDACAVIRLYRNEAVG